MDGPMLIALACLAMVALLAAGCMVSLMKIRRELADLRLTMTPDPAASASDIGLEPLTAPTPARAPVPSAPVFSTTSQEPVEVITGLGVEEQEPTVRTERVFTDAALRTGVIKAASWSYGVRKALTPENRNRIRFLMKQDVKRSRKQRRADLRAAKKFLARQAREARATGANRPSIDTEGDAA